MKHDFEYYETPQTLGRYLFDQVHISGKCLEPMVGRGAIIEAARYVTGHRAQEWITNDIDPRWPADLHLDASGDEFWRRAGAAQPDWVVSNPAFSHAITVADRGLQVAKVGVALYLRISIFEVTKTGPRRSWMADHPPNELHFLPRFAHQRSRRTGEWSTDSVTCAWAIWRHADRAQTIAFFPEHLLAELETETPIYRAHMDAIMAGRAA